MEQAEHRATDHKLVLEEQRIADVRSAIRNGRRAREQHTLIELRRGFREMRKEGR